MLVIMEKPLDLRRKASQLDSVTRKAKASVRYKHAAKEGQERRES